MPRFGALRSAVAVTCFFGLCASKSEASTITIDFSAGPAAVVVPQTFTDASGLVVEAWYLTGGAWAQTDLFRRIESPDDLGFGVCSPGEACGTGLGHGDANELSNLVSPELIRLTLPPGYSWLSVDISSADDNGTSDPASWERGQLWASDSGVPDTTPGTLFSGSPLWQIAGGAPNQTFSGFTTGNSQSSYLFFEAYDWLNGTNNNNDYLIHSVTLSVDEENLPQVPEPATMTLLGSGLLAAAMRQWRRRGFAR